MDARVVTAALVAALAAAAPGRADAASYEYLTTYTGTYSYKQNFVAAPGKPDGLVTMQTYRWTVFDYDQVQTRPGRTFESRRTRYIAARGRYGQIDVQGSAMPNGPFTSTRECAIVSSLAPVEQVSTGSYVSPVAVRDNPLVQVAWELPDYGGGPKTNNAPQFTVSGSPECKGFGSFFLAWSPSSSSPTVQTDLPATQLMRDAFSGTTTIHYSDFKRKPWTRHFRNVTVENTSSRPGFAGPSTEQAKVVVDSTVTFDRIDKYKPDKLGALLLMSGFGNGGQPDDDPPGSSGENEEVLVPGLGEGDVSLDVEGQVTPAAPRARLRATSVPAAAAPLLAHAEARGAKKGRMVRLRLRPTDAGRRLAAPHGAVAATYVLRFRPKGSTKTVTARRASTFPARP